MLSILVVLLLLLLLLLLSVKGGLSGLLLRKVRRKAGLRCGLVLVGEL